jgi:coenzyme F420 hydrogenase subunit beta
MSCESISKVITSGLCTGCGVCTLFQENSSMIYTSHGPLPSFDAPPPEDEVIFKACPGKGIDYPELYLAHYGRLPENYLLGPLKAVRTGYACNQDIRYSGASGGVMTQVLIYLLESKRIDGAILAKQGVPTPLEARPVIATTREEIISCAQSVYIPISMLDKLRDLEPGKRYALTCLPDQASSLRLLQQLNFPAAKQIKYLLGPYTGTALEPEAIRCFLRSFKVSDHDPVRSLKWRAGEWPGCLEIATRSGRTIRSPKVYYNFLIPFFITAASLMSMDFANEFCDLSVGDAWSPKFEREGGGHSVIITRSEEMEEIVSDMEQMGLLALEKIDPLNASEMHGHMIDFKKRGGYIRNTLRKALGKEAPDFGMRPSLLPLSRIAVELVISCIFWVGKSRMIRALVPFIPQTLLGPGFNCLRLTWKTLSKPTKRKGLSRLVMLRTNES